MARMIKDKLKTKQSSEDQVWNLYKYIGVVSQLLLQDCNHQRINRNLPREHKLLIKLEPQQQLAKIIKFYNNKLQDQRAKRLEFLEQERK